MVEMGDMTKRNFWVFVFAFFFSSSLFRLLFDTRQGISNPVPIDFFREPYQGSAGGGDRG